MRRDRVPVALLALLLAAPVQAAGRRSWCGTYADGARDAVWAHRDRVAREGGVRATSERSSFDVGQVAVLQDEGDLVFPRRFLDLQGASLQFVPTGGGYTVTRADRPLTTDPGTRLVLGDDDSRSVRLPFSFTFYGQAYSDVFVNSDGNLTFGGGDRASTSRSLGRFLAGPPRLGPLFTDLDPSTAGSVTTSEGADRFTVTWTDVPLFERSDKNTFQATLYRDGHIEFTYSAQVDDGVEEGVVGIAPGNERDGFTAVDFSQAAGVTGPGALTETFRDSDALDEVAVSRKFLRSHPDEFQQLVVFTSRRLAPSGVFAYERTVKSTDAGIGFPMVDLGAEYGSQRLESFVLMDWILKYPTDLNTPAAGAESTLSVLGQESGHRWLTKALFRDGVANSHELLGRDEVHWSFFMDTDGSHLEGNDIEDLGGGQFRTAAAGVKYSALDEYLMGLRSPEQVPSFFFVRNVTGTTSTGPEREPEVGVTFQGVRKDVSIADVIAALGPRNPPAGPRPPFREAFVYVSVGPPDPANIDRVERIRAAWEPFFTASTDGLGAVDTHLN